MPPTAFAQPSIPMNPLSSTAPPAASAVQNGAYTKAQFQSTMEGSRTIRNAKEIEHLLRDYPAALDLYRTGKYKVKVKSDTEVERVILVEKRTTKTAGNTQSTSATGNENQENHQAVPDFCNPTDDNKDVKQDENSRRSRSRTNSPDRAAPSTDNIVHTTISSIRMTSNTQPKVGHYRTPSGEREVSVTPPQQQIVQGRSHSREGQYKTPYGKHTNRDYSKMMVPFVPKVGNPANLWQQQQQQQQQRMPQPYFSNPLLQPQPQPRSNLYTPPAFVPQANALYRQSCYFGQGAPTPVVFPQQQMGYPPASARSIGKSPLFAGNNYVPSTRSISNSMGLPPTFRTFHSNQQPMSPFHLMYPAHAPLSINRPWTNMANEPISALTNNTNNNPTAAAAATPAEQAKGAKNRARSVDTGPGANPAVRPYQAQAPAAPVVEHYHRYRPQPQPMHNAAPAAEVKKDQNNPPKEPTSAGAVEKLTVRQLNETFMKADPSGRVPYNSLPTLIQNFGIALTENDVASAAKDLQYNVNEPISARRFVHILVKLGKITKSTQQAARAPASPTMLPEDREVTDIMTQRKAATLHPMSSSNQPAQWH